MDCGGSSGDDVQPDATSTLVHASDVPIDGLSADDVAKFNDGDALFDLPFRAADGLGPLYIRTACGACHEDGSRGPGLVQKMAIVEADGVTAGRRSVGARRSATRSARASPPARPRRSRRPTCPTSRSRSASARRCSAAATSRRSTTPRSSASRPSRPRAPTRIHGRINRVDVRVGAEPRHDVRRRYQHGPDEPDRPLRPQGARSPTLDDFTADAFQGDMGLTTPMRPTELPNPDGLTDDDARRRRSRSGSRRSRSRSTCAASRSRCASASPTRARRCSRRRSAARATCRRCTRAPTIRSRSSPTSTRRSTPTCCSTTWAPRSPTA